jgi:hypothetical protein
MTSKNEARLATARVSTTKRTQTAPSTFGVFDKKPPVISDSDRVKIDAYIAEKGVTKVERMSAEEWINTPFPDMSRKTGYNRKFKFGW